MAAPHRIPKPGSNRTPPHGCRGRAVTVMGLGLFGGGVGAARYFARQGACVTVTDLKGADALAPSIEALEGLPITFHLGGHDAADFTAAEIVAVSPAVPKTSPYLRMAEEAGAEITSEMNLFLQRCPAPIVGVTGSSGKSTTAALLGEMLSRAGPVRVGGNIGKSLLDDLEAIRPGETVVLEVSSFQLEDAARIAWSPQVAVVTNIAPNHLDRHGTLAAYIEAKKTILRFQTADGIAVLNADDDEVRGWQPEARGRVVFYSTCRALPDGVFADGPAAVFRLGDREERVDVAGRMRLRGSHNLWNVVAAAAAARLLGVAPGSIADAVAAFEPLPHRLQPVGMRGGVLFVDDSKATTPEAAALALEAFTEPVVLIAGGYDKGSDPQVMIEAIRRRAKAVVLIGATADALQRRIGTDGPVVERADRLEEAVARAAALAEAGDVVLLAPGHASWDMFVNYEQRGEVFRQSVPDLGVKGSV
ncbi:MAG TPA: UDP-N-acetylmuramoyl-L-alanine--D-glutamate ligase [Phycisphaerae bacterium]|nr:UDP-N-acetylmuramoyl-L-alanine--D-glutamate ligase [Phycisphaerae bacterium]